MQTYLRDCRWGRFLLLRGDMICQYADIWGEWAEPEITLASSILDRNANVVEVGSNIGMHAVPLAKICSEGTVLCFEPQRPLYHMLCANIALNNLLNVFARNCAVGERDEIKAIATGDYDAPWNYGSFSLAQGFNAEGHYPASIRQEPVKVIALDSEPIIGALGRVDLLKVDVEGSELAVISGARQMIAKHQPYIFAEANREEVVTGATLQLAESGYSGYWYCSGRYRDANFNRCRWLQTDAFDPNILFVPPGRRVPHGLAAVSNFGDLRAGLPVYRV